MNKVLIFYASYGGGHLSAAKSIQSYIIQNHPELDVELVDCMKYVNKSFEKMTTMAYREMAKKAPWVWGKIYDKAQKGTLAHITTRSNTIMAIKLLKLLREKQPNLIVSTHPFSSQMCSYLKRKNKINSKIATVLTDFAPHDQWLVGKEFTDYFFVANTKMKDYLIGQDIPENKVYVTGIPISNRFLESFDKAEIFNELNLNSSKRTILLFAGGEYGLGKSQTVDVFKCVVKHFKDIQLIAIAGKNEKIKEAFEDYVQKQGRADSVRVLPFTKKVPELMAISDLVITKPGGLTISESLASNLPIVVINPIPGQEEENAEFLEEKGIAVWIRKHDDPKIIITDLLNDSEKLSQMKENTNLLANKYSTRDICEIILK